MSTPYRICPLCGDNLDAGEVCDCKRQTAAAPPPPPAPSIAYINTAETARLSPYGGKKKAADA